MNKRVEIAMWGFPHPYVTEFKWRHKRRSLNTIDQMSKWVQGAVGKRLRYCDLIA